MALLDFFDKRKKKNDKAEMSFIDHLEDLRWHIIRAFIIVHIIRIVFWDTFIEIGFEILAHSWISIFVNAQRRRSVLNKYLADACFYFLQIRHCINNFLCY